MEKCYNEAKELITGNLDVLDAVAAYLNEKETITGEEFMKIMDETIEKRNLPDYGSLMPTETPDTNNSIITEINLGDENK